MNNTPHMKPIQNDLLNIFFIVYLLFFIYSFLYPSTCPTDYQVNGEAYTADMQRDDFWTFIQQDDYLKNRTGQYAERGGAKMPWHHQLDFKYLRDMNVKIGKTKHSLQLGVDVENLLNFLCKDWGLYKQITGNTLLSYNAKDGSYTYNLVNGERHLSTSQNYEALASTYRIQFTIRYLFN